MIKRLRVKFICINMAIVMTMLTVMLCFLYRTTADNLLQESIAVLEAADSDQLRPGRPGEGFGSQQVFFLRQINDKLLILGGDSYDLSDEEMVEDIFDKAYRMNVDYGVLEEYSLRFQRRVDFLGEEYVFMDISAEIMTLESLVTTCLLIGVGGFLITLVISIGLAWLTVRPVEKAWNQQRQFIADASHELKTPLTVILTNAEMLQSPDYTQEQKDHFQHSILEVGLQMKNLVESMLQLARADRGMKKAEMSRVELSNLVENSLLNFEVLYFEKGLILESRVEEGICVNGVESELRQVINILLDNGQKYADPTGQALFTLTRQGKKAVLRFFTPGQSMTPQRCKDIFQRFYRVDEARTSSGSYGLGLSIAHNIIKTHGGRIWAEPAKGGNVFFVTLPEV